MLTSQNDPIFTIKPLSHLKTSSMPMIKTSMSCHAVFVPGKRSPGEREREREIERVVLSVVLHDSHVTRMTRT